MKDDKTYLKHILDSIERVESYIKGTSYTKFSLNNMMIAAVVRELEITGEASSYYSD